ncbi:MAG: alpha/beta hydrolase-fold protein [Planctomycetota bacterium]|nr:alpha/beta hydrolase-fold protein [Planctomycetota bacterium]
MRSFGILCSLVLVVIVGAFTPAAASPDLSKSLAFTYNDGAGHTMPYRLFLPPGWNTPGAEFPLVLFLHGAGERGSDNVSQVNSHIDGLIAATQGSYPAYVLAPQVASNQQWVNISWSVGSYTNANAPSISPSMTMAMHILQDTLAARNVDPDRVYVTGLSMGGYGAWDAIARYPKTFAAAVPMSGGGNTDTASSIADIPIWAFHGSADGVVPVSGSRNMINAIKAAGGSPLYTELAGADHVIWAPIYNDASNTLYPWMFSQSTPEPATLFTLVAAGLTLLRKRRPSA